MPATAAGNPTSDIENMLSGFRGAFGSASICAFNTRLVEVPISVHMPAKPRRVVILSDYILTRARERERDAELERETERKETEKARTHAHTKDRESAREHVKKRVRARESESESN